MSLPLTKPHVLAGTNPSRGATTRPLQRIPTSPPKRLTKFTSKRRPPNVTQTIKSVPTTRRVSTKCHFHFKKNVLLRVPPTIWIPSPHAPTNQAKQTPPIWSSAVTAVNSLHVAPLAPLLPLHCLSSASFPSLFHRRRSLFVLPGVHWSLWFRDLEIWGAVISLAVTADRCEEQTTAA